MNKKSFGHLLLISLVFLGAFGLFSSLGDQALAQPKTMQNGELSGWAWSSNIGWISFNSDNTGSTVPYSVTIDPDTKVLSGYAWSSSLGWLRFGSGLTGPIEGGDNWPAKIGEDNKLTGWARFCSVYVSGCSGETKTISGSELGSWDGWLKMENVTYNQELGRFEGFSWGSLNVGWVNFLADFDNDFPPDCTPVNTVDTDCDGVYDCSTNCGGVCAISCGGGGQSVTCSVAPPTGDTNTNFTWSVSGLSGFTGDARYFDYEWSGSEDLTGEGSWANGRNQIVKTYSTPGQKTGRVTVTNGSQTASADCANEIGGNGVNVCVGDDVAPAPGEVCCTISCPGGDSEPGICGCQEDDLLGCQIDVISDPYITYYQDGLLRSQSDKVEMEITGCVADDLELISEGLDDKFEIVCSSSLDGIYSTETCQSFSSSIAPLFVWVSPKLILPSVPITRNIFQLKLEGIAGSEKDIRFDYLVGGGT